METCFKGYGINMGAQYGLSHDTGSRDMFQGSRNPIVGGDMFQGSKYPSVVEDVFQGLWDQYGCTVWVES